MFARHLHWLFLSTGVRGVAPRSLDSILAQALLFVSMMLDHRIGEAVLGVGVARHFDFEWKFLICLSIGEGLLSVCLMFSDVELCFSNGLKIGKSEEVNDAFFYTFFSTVSSLLQDQTWTR